METKRVGYKLGKVINICFPNLFGYKRNKEDQYAVIVLDVGENNETRDEIIDVEHAEYKCKTAKVLDIYDIDTNEKLISADKCFCPYEQEHTYVIGEQVTTEIIYYLSVDNLYSQLLINDIKYRNKFTGECKQWNKNGQLITAT